MKRYIRNSASLTDVLNDPEGRLLVDSIEEAEDECRYRGITLDDESEFWARSRMSDIQRLKDQFGYSWT